MSIGSIAEKRWMETKTICCFLVTPGSQPGVKCRQGSLGVVLLTCYAGPTVGAGVGSVLPVGQKYKV